MASPVVAATNTTAGTNGTSTVINMPAGIVAGDLLLVWDTNDATGTPRSQSGGSDWTRISTGANGTAISMAIFAKIAAGGDTLTLAGAAQDFASVSARITGHGVTNVAVDIIIGTPATGTDAAPDPPDNVCGGPQDYLFLESFHADDDDDTATYWSTNYSAVAQIQSANSASSCLTGVGQRALSATSENPGTMALAASEEWVAQTLSIPPTLPTEFIWFSDEYTRADSGDIGADWDDSYDTHGPQNLVSNAVRGTTLAVSATESVNAVSLPDNQYARATLKTFTGSGGALIAVGVRGTAPTARTFYLFFALRNFDPPRSQISYFNAGAETVLVSESVTTWAAGDELKGYAIGTRLTLFRKPSGGSFASLVTTVHSSLTSGRALTSIFTASAGSLANTEVEAFEAGAFTAAPGAGWAHLLGHTRNRLVYTR